MKGSLNDAMRYCSVLSWHLLWKTRWLKNSPEKDWGHLLTLTLNSDDLESHIVMNVSSTLTNTTIWIVAALSFIVDVRCTDICTDGRTFLLGLLGHLKRWPNNGLVFCWLPKRAFAALQFSSWFANTICISAKKSVNSKKIMTPLHSPMDTGGQFKPWSRRTRRQTRTQRCRKTARHTPTHTVHTVRGLNPQCWPDARPVPPAADLCSTNSDARRHFILYAAAQQAITWRPGPTVAYRNIGYAPP